MIQIKLSRVMGDRRINQAELSRRTGINKNTIADMYHGYAERVSLPQIDTICDVLGCTFEEILEWTPNEAKPGDPWPPTSPSQN